MTRNNQSEQRDPDNRTPGRGSRRRSRRASYTCTLCESEVPFAWTCRCGFSICPECFEENAWGMTCNNITWECPDCDDVRSF